MTPPKLFPYPSPSPHKQKGWGLGRGRQPVLTLTSALHPLQHCLFCLLCRPSKGTMLWLHISYWCRLMPVEMMQKITLPSVWLQIIQHILSVDAQRANQINIPTLQVVEEDWQGILHWHWEFILVSNLVNSKCIGAYSCSYANDTQLICLLTEVSFIQPVGDNAREKLSEPLETPVSYYPLGRGVNAWDLPTGHDNHHWDSIQYLLALSVSFTTWTQAIQGCSVP